MAFARYATRHNEAYCGCGGTVYRGKSEKELEK